MSVLSRISTHTIPAQRGGQRRPAAAGAPTEATAPAAEESRTSLALAALAVVLAAAIGATAYVLVDDAASPVSPRTTPATIVDLPFDSEAARDAAAASRHETSSSSGGAGSDPTRRGGITR